MKMYGVCKTMKKEVKEHQRLAKKHGFRAVK